ncbi:dTDP-4-dehydrorhamnose 3,5-epimerase family protein [Sporomusa sphaeroides]|uniref:dTDP-4-dehydrorhamnose 3,5-epimerase family protein n=1 Tax=Sporomusa sphaeroides TaxID=47679 RepID=UPI003A522585
MYKCTELYTPETEGGIARNDPNVGIVWPIKAVSLAEKDSRSPLLKDVDPGRLPTYI